MSVVASGGGVEAFISSNYENLTKTIEIRVHKLYAEQKALATNILDCPEKPVASSITCWTVKETLSMTWAEEQLEKLEPEEVFEITLAELIKLLPSHLPPDIVEQVRKDIAKPIAAATGIKDEGYKIPVPNSWKDVGYTSEYGFDFGPIKKTPPSEANVLAQKAIDLPGVKEKVEYPCIHGPSGRYNEKGETIRVPFTRREIFVIIQHLNDECNWSREKIADWLDELHDNGEVNIEFKVEIDTNE
jgi:hypothetical protein